MNRKTRILASIIALSALLLTLCAPKAKAQGLVYANGDYDSAADTLNAAKVSTDRIRIAARTQTGLTRLDASKINSGFALFSSPDVIKTIQRLPGVASGTELLSGLYVHGGTGSDNLYLLDGVPLYSTSHLIGLFSSFNSDVVEDVDFYKSGFPARYGGRLSSVVDVNTRDGNMYEWHGALSIGLIDGRFQIDGPIVKGKTSLNFGIRRTWMDAITRPAIALTKNKAMREDGQTYDEHYAFWDMNLGITHLISDSDKIKFTFFNGMDRLHGDVVSLYGEYDDKTQKETYFKDRTEEELDMTLAWGSTTAGLTWDHLFSEEMSVKTRAFYALNTALIKYDVSMWSWAETKAEDPKNLNWSTYHMQEDNSSRVHDIGIRSDFDWIPSDIHHIRFGASFQHHAYHPARKALYWQEDPKNKAIGTDVTSESLYRGQEAALYIEDEIAVGERFTVAPGLRYSAFLIDGKLYHSPEPRIAMRYDVGKDVALKLSYTDMSQYVHLVQTVFLDLPTSSWLPCTKEMKPMHSRQVAGGVYTRLPHDLHLEIEGFWKTMDNLYEYSGGFALYPPIEKWESSFSEGKGRSYGAEVDFGWTTDDTQIDLAYTLSWSQRYFPEFYHEWYFDRNDYRNILNITATHKFSKKFDIFGGWTYHTGSRLTLADQGINPSRSGWTEENGTEHTEIYYDEVYTKPYNIRMPAYHRLDVGMNFRNTTKKGNESIWNLSIYNAYCRFNPIYAEIDIDDKTGEYIGKSYGIIPIIPTVSYTLRF